MPQGYNTHGDVLTKTKDGRDLNGLWADYQAVLETWNTDRSKLVDFLTYPVSDPVELVPNISSDAKFERASEFGVPQGIRTGVNYSSFGYGFDWWDLGARFTWQFLADATAQQVDSIQNTVMEADNRLVFNMVMGALFNNVNNIANIEGNPYNVYAFYNADGTVPPKYRTTTFSGSHTHYITTNGALEAADLDDLIGLVTEHGYTKLLGYRIIVMVHADQGKIIKQFRMATPENPVDATHGDWDFIPSTGTYSNPQLLTTNTVLLGNQPSNDLSGFNVIGSYGDALIVQDDYIPSGWMPCFATGGASNLGNPIGWRQHVRPELQGMRLVKGPNPDYPLIDSYYVRGAGVGVRQRGAAAILQVASGTTYTPPTDFQQ